MTAHPHFPDLTSASAPAPARAALERARAALGFVPIAMARQAAAPAVGATFDRLLGIWAETSFTELEREVVTFALAHEIGCELCVAFHARLLTFRGLTEELPALREGRAPSDAKLAALHRFTIELWQQRGAVDDVALQRFTAAGYSAAQALELVLGITTYVLSTFANRLVRAPVDPQLV